MTVDLGRSRELAWYWIEITGALADFRKEVKDPSKAEEVARFCNYFYIAAPKGLITVDELPMAWGLLEVTAEGHMRLKVEAQKTPAEDITRPFLAALLRAASRPIKPEVFEAGLAAERIELENSFEERVEARAKSITRGITRDVELYAKHWKLLMEALKTDPGAFYEMVDIIKSVRLVLNSGVTRTWQGVEEIGRRLVKSNEQVVKALEIYRSMDK